MKRLAVVAVMIVGLVLPVCAQRSGSHGGFSGHSSAAFHGGFRGSFGGGFHSATPSRYGGYSHFTGNRFTGIARGSQRIYGGSYSSRSAYAGRERGRYRRPYRSNYGTGYPYYGAIYPYVYPGWINSFTLDNPDLFDDDDSSQAATSDQGGQYQAQPPEAYQPPDYGPYQPPPYPSAPYPYQPAPSQPNSNQLQPPSPPESQNAVTLVFKDGRPPEKIHNYLLTPTTLYVGGKHHRDIPIDQLDVDATVKVNREAGVDFSLPTTPGS